MLEMGSAALSPALCTLRVTLYLAVFVGLAYLSVQLVYLTHLASSLFTTRPIFLSSANTLRPWHGPRARVFILLKLHGALERKGRGAACPVNGVCSWGWTSWSTVTGTSLFIQPTLHCLEIPVCRVFPGGAISPGLTAPSCDQNGMESWRQPTI